MKCTFELVIRFHLFNSFVRKMPIRDPLKDVYAHCVLLMIIGSPSINESLCKMEQNPRWENRRTPISRLVKTGEKIMNPTLFFYFFHFAYISIEISDESQLDYKIKTKSFFYFFYLRLLFTIVISLSWNWLFLSGAPRKHAHR